MSLLWPVFFSTLCLNLAIAVNSNVCIPTPTAQVKLKSYNTAYVPTAHTQYAELATAKESVLFDGH